MAALDDILEPGPAERLATGFVFTEGPSWHPDGFYYFVDIRRSLLFRLRPGQRARDRAQRDRRGQRHDLRSRRAAS